MTERSVTERSGCGQSVSRGTLNSLGVLRVIPLPSTCGSQSGALETGIRVWDPFGSLTRFVNLGHRVFLGLALLLRETDGTMLRDTDFRVASALTVAVNLSSDFTSLRLCLLIKR